MKEFSSQTGGRYTYADDVLNLQDLALAFGEIFHECDGFILSGCEVSGNSITPGYVYLNGKIRYFSGASSISTWPQYIYEVNRNESVAYVSGGDKIGRKVYGCTNGSTVPTATDPLTNAAPASIAIPKLTGGRTMKDAFFGKYALLLEPTAASQSVNSIINLLQAINVNGVITANNHVKVKSGSLLTDFYYENGNLTVSTTLNSGKNYRLKVEDGVGYCFYVDGVKVASFQKTGVIFNVPITSTEGRFGSTYIAGGTIYNGTDASNDGVLNINMVGYGGGTSYYRNTIIGNGKGVAILTITGSSKTVGISGVLKVASNNAEGVTLKSDNYTRGNVALQKWIGWQDSVGYTMAYVGYLSNTDQIFSIQNNCAGIEIKAAAGNVVNIGPYIAENGVKLEDKYYKKTDVDAMMSTTASSSDVYTRSAADMLFAKISNGLSQFIVGPTTASTLRTQIGAAGATDLSNYARLSNHLSDMAATEADKKAIRENIGAAAASEVASSPTDTGWKQCTGTGATSLYARQIGNIVCIQGKIKTTHSGTCFTVPNTIAAPAYDTYWCYNHSNIRTWRGGIAAGSHNFDVTYCDGSCGQTTEFSMTYMI